MTTFHKLLKADAINVNELNYDQRHLHQRIKALEFSLIHIQGGDSAANEYKTAILSMNSKQVH